MHYGKIVERAWQRPVAGIAEAWRGRDMTNKEVAGRHDWHIDMAKANW